jgi:hypothetical protein
MASRRGVPRGVSGIAFFLATVCATLSKPDFAAYVWRVVEGARRGHYVY